MSERYTAVAIVLHWLIAIGILALIGIGLAMTHLTLATMLQFQLYQLHKSIGITVLLGVLLHILWRVFHPPPALPDMPRLEKAAAEGAHTLLYVLMIGWDGERRESDYWIQLETTPQPFGGRRWWFVCPQTGGRAAKLYLPNGAFTFASRRAYRLAYACRREPAHYRALRRAFKLRGKLGAEGGIGDYVRNPSGCAGEPSSA